MNLNDFIGEIEAGHFDFALNTLSTAIRSRRERMVPQLRIGDTVVYNNNCRQTYLRGVKGVVTKLNRKTVQVQVENNPMARRFSNSSVRTPITIVDKV